MGLMDALGKLIARVTASASSAAAAAAGKTASYSGSSSGSSGTSEYNAFSSIPKQNENNLVQTDFQNDFLFNGLPKPSYLKKSNENKTHISPSFLDKNPIKSTDSGQEQRALKRGLLFNPSNNHSTTNVANTNTDNAEKELNKTISIDELNGDLNDEAISIMDGIASKYLIKQNPTDTEKMQAIVLNFIAQDLGYMQNEFQKQEDEDGWVSDAYNLAKRLTDLGISNEDIQSAISEQQRMISELAKALNGVSNETFEECFKRWTGTEYNQDKINAYYEAFNQYQIANSVINKGAMLDQIINKGSSFQDILDGYLYYYGGDEEKAVNEINKFFNDALANNSEYSQKGYGNIYTLLGPVKSIKLVKENGEYRIQYEKAKDTVYGIQPEANAEYETFNVSLSEYPNVFRDMPSLKTVSYTSEAKEKAEEFLGTSLDTIQENFAKTKFEAFGNQSSYEKLINKYCEDQEGFKDKLSAIVQTTGTVMMVGGAVVCCACPPAGIPIMSAGQKIAVAGMFLDEGLDFLDEITSENISAEDLNEIFKETATDLALYYSGRGINEISGGVYENVLSASGSKILAKFAEIGVDAPMSLMADLIITGDIDLTGEGLSQFMSVLTGVAGGKIQKYNKNVSENAIKMFDGDINSQTAFMKAKGLSTNTIIDIYSKLGIDVDKAHIESSTADITNTLNQYGIKTNNDNICGALILEAHDIEITPSNIKAAQGLEAKGFKITADNVANASKLVDAGIKINEENLKYVQLFESNNVELSKHNIKTAKILLSQGLEINGDNLKYVQLFESNNIELSDYNIEIAKTLEAQGLKVTKENMLTLSPGMDVYNKISSQLQVTTNKQVIDMVDSIIKTTGVTEQEALYSLQMLSQYSNMESLGELAEILRTDKYNVSSFEQTPGISANNALYYMAAKKSQLQFEFGGKKAFILDEYALSYLEGLKTENPSEFNNLISDKNNVFIYPEGWNSGFNVYKQQTNTGSIETQASDISIKAKLVQKSKGISYEEAFKQVMDESTTQRIEALGITDKVEKVSLTDDKFSVENATAKGVVDNLKPMNISQEKVDVIIKTIAEEMYPNEPTKAERAKTLITGYLEAELDVYSPQKLGARLKETHSNIEKTISKWKKSDGTSFTMDDVYYAMPYDYKGPYEIKSYHPIALQYAQLNGVDSSKFIKFNAPDISNIPDDKIVVVLDDCVGGGASMLYQGDGFKYSETDFSNIGNRHMIMAPITSGATGAQAIKNRIKLNGREGKDVLLIDDSQIQKPYKETDFYKNLNADDRELLNQILEECDNKNPYPFGLDGFSGYAMCFPYMSPDNDASLPSLLFESLMLNPQGIKNRINKYSSIARKVHGIIDKMDV